MIVVLVALTIIATPFALSMRNLESSALLGLRRQSSRASTATALAAATRQLEETHAWLDLGSPHRDRAAEVSADDLAERFADLLPRNPRGSIRSVRVGDESGRVDLTRATPALLGNLLGGRSFLTAAIGPEDDALALGSTDGLPPAGLLFVEREQVEYSVISGQTVDELRRGFSSANVARSTPAAHMLGAEVFDARLFLLAQRGWRVRPGVFEPYRRVDGLKDIALFSELAYDAATLERLRPLLTVHGGPLRWRDPERVLGLEPRSDGAVDLWIAGGERYGPGAVVRLTSADGERHYDLVLAATPWGERMRVTLLEGVFGGQWVDDAVAESLAPVPVNLNTAGPDVLEALLTGLGAQPVTDVITDSEAVHLALLIDSAPPSTSGAEWTPLAQADLDASRYSPADLAAALAAIRAHDVRPGVLKPSELASLLAGARSLSGSHRLGRPAAIELAKRIAAAQPGSHDELRSLLDGAVADQVLSPDQRNVILINAVDSLDARIVGGTAPFSYASRGVFELHAGSSENAANGRELASSRARQIVSVAPAGETGRVLATQADLEAAARGGGAGGWASWPNLMDSGPGPDPGFTLEQLAERRAPIMDSGSAGLSLASALTSFAGPADGAGTLVGGRAGPSTDEGRAFTALRPVRSPLPDTLHFDEGAPQLTGATADGWNTEVSPLRFDASQLQPSLTDPLDDRMLPFTVSFWFELEDVSGETVLFDTGASELEDRVLIMVKGGELLFRVADTSVADFRGPLLPGRLPPAGEIRYAFDDGLALLPGVPYHLAAYVGGGRSTSMALFIDGFSRGKRSFVTRLMEDLSAVGGPFLGSSSGQGVTRMRVESTAGFPERGALQLGEEIVEYTSRTEDTFVLAAAATDDPFGGRARRGSFGGEHLASEPVELVGYSRALASLFTPAGNGSLDGMLAPMALAQLDGSQLATDIEILPRNADTNQIVDFPFSLGTGLPGDATTIPVASVDGGALPEGVFQTGGGYAVIFCDYGYDQLIGQVIAAESGFGRWIIGNQTDESWYIGGAEVVRYSSYSGGLLTGVSRGATGGIPVSIEPGATSPLDGASQDWVVGSVTSWGDARAFITNLSSHLQSELNSLPLAPRVLVMPISVAVTDGVGLYEGYHSGIGNPNHLIQVGTDFPEGGGGTEWIRWNTVTSDAFVRDELNPLEQALDHLGRPNGVNAWDPNVAIDEGMIDDLNGFLRFRGQAGTPDTSHAAAEQVLPVIPFYCPGGELEPSLGLPGRHDFVTMVGDEGSVLLNGQPSEREWNEVNYATTQDQDWSGYSLVGMRGPVVGTYERTEDHEFSIRFKEAMREGGQGWRLAENRGLTDENSIEDYVKTLNVDSRRLTRLLCGPSGELPDVPALSLHLGEDFNRRTSPGAAIIDELQLHVHAPLGPLLPAVARFTLDEELSFEEDRVLLLDVQEQVLPHVRQRNGRLGKENLEILSELSPSGGLLLLGEEIVAYAGLDPVESGAVFLAGRGLYGTRRAAHSRNAPVVPLRFWPVSPLIEALGPDDGDIVVADPLAFPYEGGLLLVDEELLAYNERLDDALAMPLRAGRSASGLLRGRFGTVPASHSPGSLVRWMPTRYHDQALFGDDVPEAQALALAVDAPGAFFTDVIVRASEPDRGVELLARAVLDGQGRRHDDPASHPGVVALSRSDTDRSLLQGRVLAQGDLLELFLMVRWAPGAFDPVRGSSNAWKLAPRVSNVMVGHVQPTLVFEHEEWR